MAVSDERFDAIRAAVQVQLDRVRALAPLIERALQRRHGPYWQQLLADRERAAGRSVFGLHDPRCLLRLIVHEPALGQPLGVHSR